MPRRPNRQSPDELRKKLTTLLNDFKQHLCSEDLREKVLALIPAFHMLRDLGSSLIPSETASAARDRILLYFLKYPFIVIHGDEIMVVSGIQDWPRRVRELRCERGWAIASGVTVREMYKENDILIKDINIESLKPEEYILLNEIQDREAAFRWKLANDIRGEEDGVRNKILKFLRQNVGQIVTGEELRYIAKGKTEWARRVRELRTEHGWPIATKNTGRPDLPIGTHMLEEDRQSPAQDRNIPGPTRRAVPVRDDDTCQQCGWNHDTWNPADPRHIELHHIKPHVDGGENHENNLLTLCTVCHDEVHRK